MVAFAFLSCSILPSSYFVESIFRWAWTSCADHNKTWLGLSSLYTCLPRKRKYHPKNLYALLQNCIENWSMLSSYTENYFLITTEWIRHYKENFLTQIFFHYLANFSLQILVSDLHPWRWSANYIAKVYSTELAIKIKEMKSLIWISMFFSCLKKISVIIWTVTIQAIQNKSLNNCIQDREHRNHIKISPISCEGKRSNWFSPLKRSMKKYSTKIYGRN